MKKKKAWKGEKKGCTQWEPEEINQSKREKRTEDGEK